MPDSFACDWCGHKFPVGPRGDGLVVHCPQCGKSLMVQAESAKPKPSTAVPARSTSAVHPSPPPAPVNSEPCPFCGAAMSREVTKCAACGFDASTWNPVGTATEPRKKRAFSYLVAVLLVVTALLVLAATVFEHLVSTRTP